MVTLSLSRREKYIYMFSSDEAKSAHFGLWTCLEAGSFLPCEVAARTRCDLASFSETSFPPREVALASEEMKAANCPPHEVAARGCLAIRRASTFGKAGNCPPSEPAMQLVLILGGFRSSGRLAIARRMNPPCLFSWFCSSFVHFDAKTFWTGQIT